MGKDLVIVESPAKAKTINKYLGDGYVVKASVGHVRDLPKQRLGVDVEHGFKPEYEVIKGKSKVMTEIRKAAKSADKVYLAPDPDREGEAIAWHVAEELGVPKDKVYRVLFNEITSRAVLEAMKKPGKIDYSKVDAQQARRVLDRLVGYQVSPLLWKKVKRGLSAGRVQTVAVRLVCEREQEINNFVSKEYWSIVADLRAGSPPPFSAKLYKESGKKLDAYAIKDEAAAAEILRELEGGKYAVSSVEKKERKQNPIPPFTTSKLQQEAARKLRFTAKKTMAVAQQLYEGVEVGAEGSVGLITYMRTDSTRIAPEALKEAREYIGAKYGPAYLPAKPPVYASQKKAQEAHEAVRPTSMGYEPDSLKQFLEPDQLALYRLIWNRFVASQMNPAVLDQTGVDITSGRFTFRATGTVVKFPGFMAVYTEGKDEEKAEDKAEEDSNEEKSLPALAKGDALNLDKLDPKQHFTQPPPRYTEASLVKELEEKGIGRPSTYAAIMSTIVDREYVEKRQAAFFPTELGTLVNDLLVQSFPDLFDVAFTAKMEDELDDIEEGKMPWAQAVADFYGPFEKALATAQKGMRNVKREEVPTDIPCDKCGKMMVIKWGRNGKFLACPGYPECRNTRELPGKEGEAKEARPEVPVETTDEVCPKCGSPMVIKSGRFGKFLACSAYPGCKTTKPISLGVDCPKCGKGFLSERRTKGGKSFFGCSTYPKCDYATWDRPVPRPCPDCKHPFLVEKYSKKEGARVVCPNKECGYKEERPQEEPAATGGEKQ